MSVLYWETKTDGIHVVFVYEDQRVEQKGWLWL